MIGDTSPCTVPFIPTEGPPAATAAKAYSICTSLPEGLKNQKPIIELTHLLQ